MCSLQLKYLSDYQAFKHNFILEESTKKTASQRNAEQLL